VALSESDLCGGVLQGPKFRWHGYRFDHNELDPIIIASYKLAYCMTVVTSVTKVLSNFKDGANDTKSCGSHVPIVSQLVVSNTASDTQLRKKLLTPWISQGRSTERE
jgi:hypothetical protein